MKLRRLWIFAIFLLTPILAACAPKAGQHRIVFENQPCIIPVKNFTYRTCSPLYVNVDGTLIIIPTDFETDLASIPRPFWNILPPQQTNFVGPAILHDYLYSVKVFSRKTSDDILYRALLGGGARLSTSGIMWSAVRIFGGRHYDR